MAERSNVDIRRSMVIKDALREAKKTRFDVNRLLNVSTSPEVDAHTSCVLMVCNRYISFLSKELTRVGSVENSGDSLVKEW